MSIELRVLGSIEEEVYASFYEVRCDHGCGWYSQCFTEGHARRVEAAHEEFCPLLSE